MLIRYGESTYETTDAAFGGHFVRATGVLCPDGIRRTARPSADGIADTFYSVPAFVYARANGRTVRVYGYVTIDSHRDSAPDTVRFVPYRYRRHHAAVCHPSRADDATCLHCGAETCTLEGSRSLVHARTQSLFCDPDAARASDWDSASAEDVHARRTALVRDDQSYRVRTPDQMRPLETRTAVLAEIAERQAR